MPQALDSPRHGALVVARYVLVEARRTGLAWSSLGALVPALFLAAFLGQVSITESTDTRALVAAALLRAAAVFLLAAHVVGSLSREFNDKGVELALALPLSRPAWYLGKLAGFSAAGCLLAAAFAAPLLAFAPGPAVLRWGLSLGGELCLVAAASLFFSATLAQGFTALAAVAGFYLLARAMPAIQAIAHSPLTEGAGGVSALGEAARWAVDALALILPRLEHAASGAWLVHGLPDWPAQLGALAGMGIYFLLLAAAGLFDFSRRSF